MSDINDWFAGRLPDTWFTETPEITVDREEILVIGRIPAPEEATAATEEGRIERFREETRTARMKIADAAEARYGRKVAWGARCGDSRQVFTSLAVPVMTRLRQEQRQVLDTLVEAGVARSRSDALGWCVRLVAEHEGEWISQLRDALGAVREARRSGPAPKAS